MIENLTYWNYRIIKFKQDGSAYYEICEVYYDEKGTPHSWSQGVNPFMSEDVDGLKKTMEQVKQAYGRPILTLSENGTLEELGGE